MCDCCKGCKNYSPKEDMDSRYTVGTIAVLNIKDYPHGCEFDAPLCGFANGDSVIVIADHDVSRPKVFYTILKLDEHGKKTTLMGYAKHLQLRPIYIPQALIVDID